jgi:hypothetical protein
VNLTAFTEQGDKGKMHNDFHAFFNLSSPNVTSGGQIRKNEMGEACSTYGMDRSSAYTVLGGGGKTDIKRPLGRPWHRWEDNTANKSAVRACTGFN